MARRRPGARAVGALLSVARKLNVDGDDQANRAGHGGEVRAARTRGESRGPVA